MNSFPQSTWCAFRSIPSAYEATLVSSCCRFSLETLEVYAHPETENCALVEKETAELWRWAVVDAKGLVIEGGRQVGQAQAKQTAEMSLRFASRPFPNSTTSVDWVHPRQPITAPSP